MWWAGVLYVVRRGDCRDPAGSPIVRRVVVDGGVNTVTMTLTRHLGVDGIGTLGLFCRDRAYGGLRSGSAKLCLCKSLCLTSRFVLRVGEGWGVQ